MKMPYDPPQPHARIPCPMDNGDASCNGQFCSMCSMMLARDAMAVMNKVWSPDQRVHVMGISMGGMVAQKLGFILAKRQRLASMTLAVTSRSYTAVPSPVSFWFLRKFLINLLVDSDPAQQAMPSFIPFPYLFCCCAQPCLTHAAQMPFSPPARFIVVTHQP